MKKHLLRLWLVLMIMLMVIGLVPVQAQEPVTISVAVPEFLIDGFPDEAIAAFEAQHPNIRVNIKPATQNPQFLPNVPVDTYLDNFEAFVSEADIMLVSSTGQISTEATRAGLLLDLSPLVLSDPTFNVDDFYFPAWQSFQWDGGIWGVPMVADVIGMVYDPEIFDNNNLPYPDSWLTMEDVDPALRELATYNDDGTVETPALIDISNSLDMVLYALMGGQRVVDDLQLPSVPDYTNPQLESLVQTWADLQVEGIVPGPGDGFQFITTAPVALVPSIFASSPAVGLQDREVTTLPANYLGLSVNGLAVSAGTQFPEEAYEFIKYVSFDPQLSNAFLGVIPARRSLFELNEEGEGTIASLFNPTEEIRALVSNYIDFAIPSADLRYGSYLSLAISKVALDGVDPATALQETEQEVLDRLAIADERGQDVEIIVATPPPAVEVAEGDIAIDFGVSAFTTNISNQEAWDNVIANFLSANPDIVDVNLEAATIFSGNTMSDMAENYDCFYTTGNVVQGGDITLLLSIDPLIASDFSLDLNDFVSGSINLMTRENAIYGLPLEIQPQSMVYDTQLINQGGAFPPYPGWTVTDFENILRTLKIDPEDPAPFRSQDFGGGTYLLALMTSYGGIPIDYRTIPASIDFTSPETVEAIRQVLDLAKDGYIGYNELANFTGAGALGGNDDPVAIYTQFLNAFIDFTGGGSEEDENNPQIPIPYPQGTTYSAVPYDIGGLYISSNTDFADACYRFISFVSGDPNVVTAMPARRSVINSPDLVTGQGESTVQLYRDLTTVLDMPNTISIPAGFGGSLDGVGDALVGIWLVRAFDRYVLEDADLGAELEEAQLFSQNYQDCAALIPPYDPAVDQTFTYIGNFFDCATQVDPTMEEILPSF